jgi:predicted transcriptional regulator
MKIAITLPKELIPRVEELALKFGVSANDLCIQAINHFLESQSEKAISREDLRKMSKTERDAELTRQLNEVYEHVDSSLDPVVMQMQMTALDQ